MSEHPALTSSSLGLHLLPCSSSAARIALLSKTCCKCHWCCSQTQPQCTESLSTSTAWSCSAQWVTQACSSPQGGGTAEAHPYSSPKAASALTLCILPPGCQQKVFDLLNLARLKDETQSAQTRTRADTHPVFCLWCSHSAGAQPRCPSAPPETGAGLSPPSPHHEGENSSLCTHTDPKNNRGFPAGPHSHKEPDNLYPRTERSPTTRLRAPTLSPTSPLLTMTPVRAQLVPTCGRNRPRWRQRIILTAPAATPRPPSTPPTPHRSPCIPQARPAPHGLGWRRIPHGPTPRSPLRLSATESGKGRRTHFRFRDALSSPALRSALRRGRRDKNQRGERGAELR